MENKKYLDKVIDHLVKGTKIDYDEEMLYTPFSFPRPFTSHLFLLFFPPHYFSHHCKNIYGLNDDEVKYIWKKYKHIIKDKIENNGQ